MNKIYRGLVVFAVIVIKMFICWIIIKLIGFIKKLGKNFWRNILMREKDGYVSYTIFGPMLFNWDERY